MINYFTIDGVSCRDFGVYLASISEHNIPVRDVSVISIPGRNGDLLIDKGNYKNVKVEFECWIHGEDMEKQFLAFKNKLLKPGYRRIEMSIHPNEYRLMYLSKEISVTRKKRSLSFKLTFSAKPQRFLKRGEIFELLSLGTTMIFNPTDYASKPLLRLSGSGSITVNGITIQVSNNTTKYVDVDCEIMETYYGNTPANNKVTLVDDEYITLNPGANSIKITGLDNVRVTPRWWTL